MSWQRLVPNLDYRGRWLVRFVPDDKMNVMSGTSLTGDLLHFAVRYTYPFSHCYSSKHRGTRCCSGNVYDHGKASRSGLSVIKSTLVSAIGCIGVKVAFIAGNAVFVAGIAVSVFGKAVSTAGSTVCAVDARALRQVVRMWKMAVGASAVGKRRMRRAMLGLLDAVLAGELRANTQVDW